MAAILFTLSPSARSAPPARRSNLRSQPLLGRKGLRSRKNRTYRSAALAQAHDEAEAKRLLAEGVAAAGFENELLERLPGSDIRKVALADLLLTCTVVRQSWIADQLAMRSAAT